MSKQILTNYDFNKNEVQNARVQNLAAAPASPVEGQMYWNTATKRFEVWNATAWGLNASDSALLGGNTSAYHLARANHTGTQLAATISDFATAARALFSVTDTATLDLTYTAGTGVITGAVLDSPTLQGQNSAYHLARGNHTGTQLSTTISDFTEAAQDAVGAMVTGNTETGITVTYDDVGNLLNFAVTDSPTVAGVTPAQLRDRATHTGTQLSTTISDFTEAAQDAVGAMVTGNTETGITVTYDDVGNVLNFAVTDSPTVGGFTPANLRDRSTHTGTQTASTISDLATVVQAYRLDQFAVPTADLNINSHKLTNLTDPTNPQDAATKNYVDLARQGIRLKDSVRVATTAAITLSGTQTIDGIAVVAGDRVLVKDQAAPAANGIYIVAAGAWTRATDADTAAELADGATVWVNLGTINANTTWSQINTIATLGTDAQAWAQQGAATSYVGGAGLTLTGGTFDVGAGTGITVGTDTVGIDTAVVARKFTQSLAGSATSYVVTHGLGNQWVTVQVFETSGSFRLVDTDVELTDANNVTIRFTTAPATNAYRVVITG